MAVGLAILTGFGTKRIEALSVVLTDDGRPGRGAAAELSGPSISDPLVVDALEAWAAGEAAVSWPACSWWRRVVLVVAIVPTLLMRGAPATRGRATIAPDGRAAATRRRRSRAASPSEAERAGCRARGVLTGAPGRQPEDRARPPTWPIFRPPRDPEARVWVDIDDADQTILDQLAACLGIHPLVAEDILERNQRAKVEHTGDTLHIVMFALVYESGARRSRSTSSSAGASC